MKENRGSTKRVEQLLEMLLKHGETDRLGEWFTQDMFHRDDRNKVKMPPDEPVIVRRAEAFAAMLRAMTNPENSITTRTLEILPGELIVGVVPLGSLGFGKVFPEYMTEEEMRVGSFTSQDSTDSVLGHNVADHEKVLKGGFREIIRFCKDRITFLEIDRDHPLGTRKWIDEKLSFYKAVLICSNAVVTYARDFADLAEEEAITKRKTDPERAKELDKIAAICRKVPYEPAETFHEAVQSIWFTHLALHATLNHVSLGRLDQILQPFYEKSIKDGEINEQQAIELLECFIIKACGPLNLNPDYFEKMDHMDYGASLSTNPIVIDQYAAANNYLQSIVVGGQTREGADATNDCSYLFLGAYASIGVFTPTLYARIHKNSPDKFLKRIAKTILDSDCGLPTVYNDDVIIPALCSSDIPVEEARDYVADGCWEPILNANSDWTFGTINMLTVLECAMNGGALLTNNPQYLRGQKMGFLTPFCTEIEDFEQLKELVTFHMRFFTDQIAMGLYSFYSIHGSITPTPFLSALMGGCLKKGIDKTWGGTDYIIGGIIADAMPNCANSLAAIKEWVYEKGVYTLPQVVDSLKNDFQDCDSTQQDFISSPKFGNNDPYVDEIMKWLLDEFYQAVCDSKELADFVFLYEPKDVLEQEKMESLRSLAGYAGDSMKKKYGEDFKITVTAGCGTFENYANMGLGCAASADGRNRGKPIAPNFSPVSGTDDAGIGHLLQSLDNFGLDRFGAGVIVDVCLEESDLNEKLLVEVLRKFVEVGGNIISITIAGHLKLEEIYRLCEGVRAGRKEPSVLDPYNQISVRVGGFQAPFVTLPKEQQKDYLKRSISGRV